MLFLDSDFPTNNFLDIWGENNTNHIYTLQVHAECLKHAARLKKEQKNKKRTKETDMKTISCCDWSFSDANWMVKCFLVTNLLILYVGCETKNVYELTWVWLINLQVTNNQQNLVINKTPNIIVFLWGTFNKQQRIKL